MGLWGCGVMGFWVYARTRTKRLDPVNSVINHIVVEDKRVVIDVKMRKSPPIEIEIDRIQDITG
jgi:hypothetical protein